MKQISDSTTDQELVRLSLADPNYFGVLVDRYEAKLTRYIRRRSSASLEDIQDLLQDIFIKVYTNLNDFDASLSFSSWIYRITHNQVISWHRKHHVRSRDRISGESGKELLNLAADILDMEHVQWSGDMKQVIQEKLSLLKPDYHEIILLRFFEEKEYNEISDILQIPPGTVATRINRAKKKLHETLKPHL